MLPLEVLFSSSFFLKALSFPSKAALVERTGVGGGINYKGIASEFGVDLGAMLGEPTGATAGSETRSRRGGTFVHPDGTPATGQAAATGAGLDPVLQARGNSDLEYMRDLLKEEVTRQPVIDDVVLLYVLRDREARAGKESHLVLTEAVEDRRGVVNGSDQLGLRYPGVLRGL